MNGGGTPQPPQSDTTRFDLQQCDETFQDWARYSTCIPWQNSCKMSAISAARIFSGCPKHPPPPKDRCKPDFQAEHHRQYLANQNHLVDPSELFHHIGGTPHICKTVIMIGQTRIQIVEGNRINSLRRRLPNSSNFVTQRRSVNFILAGSNEYSPMGVAIIKLVLASSDWLVPFTVRVCFKLSQRPHELLGVVSPPLAAICRRFRI